LYPHEELIPQRMTQAFAARQKEQYPFAEYADGRYPLLRIAAADQFPAHGYKVEWLVDRVEDGRFVQDTEENFTQITRTPFSPDPASGDREQYRALEAHLRAVEDTLWFGVPSYERNGPHGHPIGFCGGVLHYLGRAPLRADRIVLHVLQDCVLLKDGAEAGRRLTHEFLSEYSLQVCSGEQILPYSEKRSRNAWTQGVSLNQENR
jgi:hypothetical protein